MHSGDGVVSRKTQAVVQSRKKYSEECEERVRIAVRKFETAGLPFSVQELADFAGVSRSYIYARRNSHIRAFVLAARDQSKKTSEHVTSPVPDHFCNCQALLKGALQELDLKNKVIAELNGAVFDEDGFRVSDVNRQLKETIRVLTDNWRKAEVSIKRLERQLEAARAHLSKERSRSVREVAAELSFHGVNNIVSDVNEKD